MRPSRLQLSTRLALAVLLLLSLAGPRSAAVAADPPAGDSTQPQLHQASKACGKKWVRQARQLSAKQVSWMLARSHRIYHVDVRGGRIATLEILSAASFRDCNVLRHWDKRETNIRVTLFRPDGSTRVLLSNFAIDDVYFNGEPTFYPQMGRVLLRGVAVDGRELSRWLEVDAMRPIYAHHTAGRRPVPVLASDEGPTPVRTASVD